MSRLRLSESRPDPARGTGRRTRDVFLRTVFETSSDAAVLVDDVGRCMDANPAACALAGLGRSELLASHLADLLRLSRDGTAPGWAELLSSGPGGAELVLSRKGGDPVPIRLRFISDVRPSRHLVWIRAFTPAADADKELRFQARALSQVNDVVIASDPLRRVTFWNESAERLYGIKSGAILGQPLARAYDVLWPDPARERDAAEQLRSAGCWEGHVVHATRSGRAFVAQSEVSILRDEGGRPAGFLTVTRDVTKRWQAEENLRATAARLRLLTEQMPIALWTVNPSLVITSVTGAFFGRGRIPEAQSYLGKPLGQVLVQEGGGEHPGIAAHRKALGGQSAGYEFRQGSMVFEGQVAPLRDADGQITGVIGAGMDITGRKRSEEMDQDLARAVRSSADAVITLDAEGNVTSWNHGAERLFGYPESEILGAPIRRLVPEDRRAEFEAVLARVQSGERLEQVETRRITKSGAQVDVSVTLSPVRDAGGAFVGVSKIVRDITGPKRAHEEVGRLNVTLEHLVAERTADLEASLTELDTFAYTVAHDLRAPLRAMAGLSDLLVSEYSGKPFDDEGRDFARRISESARRLDLLIQDLLTYSRLTREEVDLEPVDLDEVAEQVLIEMDPLVRERRGRVEVVGRLPVAFAHATFLKQALTNLLSNALKFVPTGVDPRVRIWAEPRQGSVRLWVEDNGIGIAPEYQERVFGLFVRLDPGREASPGTGIGLAIVRRAMERMDGSVGLESEPGKGSRFYLELPLTERRRAHSRRHGAARPRPGGPAL